MSYLDSYHGCRVLVTGDTGFKGSWLCQWLLRLGAEVHGLANAVPTSPALFDMLQLKQRMTHHSCDIRDLDAVRQVISDFRPNVVFHLAAQAIVAESYADPVNTISTNVIGTTHVLEALRLHDKPCAALIITSDKCYDNVEWPWGYRENDALGGKDIYSGSKSAAEMIFHSYYHSFFEQQDRVRLATARAGHVIGGDWAAKRIVPDCMRAWSQDEAVVIRSPQATRPWQHVLEPLSGYLLLGQKLLESPRLSGTSYNFGPGADQNFTVERLLQDMAVEWQYENPTEAYHVTGDRVIQESGLLKLNCDKALLDLNWMTTLRYNEMVAMTGKWYFAHYRENSDMIAVTSKQIERYESLAAERRRL